MKWAKAAGFATSRILLANTGRADGTGGTIKWVTVGSCSVVARLVTNVLHEFMQDSTGHDGSVDPRDSLECEWLLVRSELPSDRLQARLEGNDWHKRVMLWGHQAMHRHITGWRVYQPMHRDALLADESTRRAWSIMHWGSRVPSVVRRQTAPWTICIYTVLLHYWLYRPLLYLVVLADPKRMSA